MIACRSSTTVTIQIKFKLLYVIVNSIKIVIIIDIIVKQDLSKILKQNYDCKKKTKIYSYLNKAILKNKKSEKL